MLPVAVLEEVECGLADMGIARIEDGHVVFLDGDEALTSLVPPPSLRQNKVVWGGLEYLRTAKPPIALLLTMHYEGSDFHRLVKHTGHILRASPVCGVEAHGVEGELAEGAIPRPQPYETNEWLRAFQMEQFPWLDDHNKLMLPCEPVWDGPLAVRLNEVDETFDAFVRGRVSGYSAEAWRAMLYPLNMYGSIFRTWGLLGQFGYWLSRPQVQERLAGYQGHIPLTLGAGHTAQRFILQEYCKLDVIASITDRSVTYDGIAPEVVWENYRKYQEIMLAQTMTVADLGLSFPSTA